MTFVDGEEEEEEEEDKNGDEENDEKTDGDADNAPIISNGPNLNGEAEHADNGKVEEEADKS